MKSVETNAFVLATDDPLCTIVGYERDLTLSFICIDPAAAAVDHAPMGAGTDRKCTDLSDNFHVTYHIRLLALLLSGFLPRSQSL